MHAGRVCESEVGDVDIQGIFAGEEGIYTGLHFWARSFWVSTVGLDD